MPHQLVGIDWGTSNRRAYLLDAAGHCLRTHSDDQGMFAVQGRFAASLAALLGTLHADADAPVVMSGMVGSAHGWQTVPYLDSAHPLQELARALVPVQDNTLGRPCLIVPGYCYRGDWIDVMRGEETQLMGALAMGQRDGWVVLPGTHSKWVKLDGVRIAHWSTFMTGELFQQLSGTGTLAALMAADAPFDHAAFTAGVAEARHRRPLSQALFRVRANVVAGERPAAAARDFVSGLLIGTEFIASGTDIEAITLVGSASLCRNYQLAAAQYGIAATLRDPDQVYCAALAQIQQAAPWA